MVVVRGKEWLKRTRFSFLGGGFAGLYAALQLEKALPIDNVSVTLINRETLFCLHLCFTRLQRVILTQPISLAQRVSYYGARYLRRGSRQGY